MSKNQVKEKQAEAPEAEAPAEMMNPATGEIVPASEAPANAVAVPNNLDDMMEGAAGQGMEEMSHDDLLIPFLKLLQASSPQATKGHIDYIKGAEAGSFLNNEEVFSGEQGIYFQPVKYVHQYTEWKPRQGAGGGGLVGYHDESIMKVAIEQENGSYKLPNGNDLVRSSTWFGLLVKPEQRAFTQVVVSLAGTQVKSGKALNSAVNGLRKARKDGSGEFTPPAWSSVFRATTSLRTNDKGSWYVWNFSRVGYLQDMFTGVDANFATSLFRAGQAMYEGIQSGMIKAAAPPEEEVASSGNAGKDDF